jgi:tetratricopeptide (TPR) repeat protein
MNPRSIMNITYVPMNRLLSKLVFLELQVLVLAMIPAAISGQSSKDKKNIFAQAESYFLYEEYERANELYLLIDNPGNLNLQYKIGTCYLNIPDEKEKAIPYLEAAVKKATYDSKTESYKEMRAPLDAYFNLAKAYMIKNEFNKALSTFQKFNNLARGTEGKGGMENLAFVGQQIQACRNAIQAVENPITLSRRMLGDNFSPGSMNENPAMSFDGNTLVYTERRGVANVILFSRKINGKWQAPVEISDDLNSGEDCSACALNRDGTELFIYKKDNFDGNLYSSRYVNNKWTPVTKLNKNINTKFYESHASISYDGRRLYFTSNREGGQGGLDILVSEKEAGGDWGAAMNLGSTINTPYNEDCPFITMNDSILYFSSEGHNSIGGYDNFKSRSSTMGWETPVNLGYPINDPDDNKFYQPHNNGKQAFYSIKTGYKKKDIFFITIDSSDAPSSYTIRGRLSLTDGSLSAGKKYSVLVRDKKSGASLHDVSPDISSGSYLVNVGPGSYKIVFSGEGYLPGEIDTTILGSDTGTIITIDITLEPEPPIKQVEKIEPENIPAAREIDPSLLEKNKVLKDVTDTSLPESEVLYYTVQVMALYNPVDVSYFRHVTDIKVVYNETDRFYRYTTGRFSTREEAEALRSELLQEGYGDDIFIRKVYKQ